MCVCIIHMYMYKGNFRDIWYWRIFGKFVLVLLFSNTPSIFRGINLNIYRREKKAGSGKEIEKTSRYQLSVCDSRVIFIPSSPVLLLYDEYRPNHVWTKHTLQKGESSNKKQWINDMPTQGSTWDPAAGQWSLELLHSSTAWVLPCDFPEPTDSGSTCSFSRTLLLLLMISSPTCSLFPSAATQHGR